MSFSHFHGVVTNELQSLRDDDVVIVSASAWPFLWLNNHEFHKQLTDPVVMVTRAHAYTT